MCEPEVDELVGAEANVVEGSDDAMNSELHACPVTLFCQILHSEEQFSDLYVIHYQVEW